MSDADIRNECSDLVARFAYYVDHREFDKAVALFAIDGIFERPDLKASGREKIAGFFAHRPPSVVTRHLCGQPFFIEIDGDTAKSVTAVTLYNTTHEGEGLPTVKSPNAVAEFHDTFKKTSDGWKIAHRRGVPVLLIQA
jgi:hypothetical protein